MVTHVAIYWNVLPGSKRTSPDAVGARYRVHRIQVNSLNRYKDVQTVFWSYVKRHSIPLRNLLTSDLGKCMQTSSTSCAQNHCRLIKCYRADTEFSNVFKKLLYLRRTSHKPMSPKVILALFDQLNECDQ